MPGRAISTLICGGVMRNMVCITTILAWSCGLTFSGDYVRYAPDRLLVNTNTRLQKSTATARTTKSLMSTTPWCIAHQTPWLWLTRRSMAASGELSLKASLTALFVDLRTLSWPMCASSVPRYRQMILQRTTKVGGLLRTWQDGVCAQSPSLHGS